MPVQHKDLTHDLKKSLIAHDPTVDARLVRVLTELKTGFAFLETLMYDKVVTILGSARTKPTDKFYQKARQLAFKLAKSNFTIITGGGPGIMEAGNRGADEAGGRSIGVNIYLPQGERKNKWVRESVSFYYFFNRKVILDYTAEAFVFFPGGFGTFDELFEICNLIITKKIEKKIPIVLFGKSFWNPMQKWLKKIVVKKSRALAENELKIFIITDDVDAAAAYIKKNIQIPKPDKV